MKDIPDIKVVTGVRRSRKSILLDAFSSLYEADDDANVARIHLNQKKYRELLVLDILYEYIEEQYRKDKKNDLFIDEVQRCKGFEAVIDSLYREAANTRALRHFGIVYDS